VTRVSRRIVIDLRREREIPHGVARAAIGRGVRLRAVDNPPLVQTALVRFEAEVDRLILIHVHDLGIKDVCGRIDWLVLAKAVGVGSWDHRHAAVFWRRAIDR